MGFLLGVIVGLVMVVIFVCFENRRSKSRTRLAVSTAAFSALTIDDVRRFFVKQSIPYWVTFMENQKVGWLNLELKKIWPYIDCATSELTTALVEPILDQYKPPVISSFKFQKFTLGTIAPQFVGPISDQIRVQMIESTEEEIVMEVEVQWDGNPSIILAVRTMLGVTLPIQVKNVALAGVVRLVFKPLVDIFPCFGAIMYSKNFDFKLKVIGGDIKSFPVLAGAIDGMIRTAVTDSLLWPMRQVVPILAGDYRNLELRAVGTLEVKLVQAKDLLNMDFIGKSDPFAQLYIRPIAKRMKKSKTINNQLNPIWNERFEFDVEDLATQKLIIHVFDEEGVQTAELIGSTQIPLMLLQPGTVTEFWLSLVKDLQNSTEAKHRGQIHVELLYRPFDLDTWEASIVKEKSLGSQPSLTGTLSNRKPALSYEISSKRLKPALHYTLSPGDVQNKFVRGILSVTVVSGSNLVAKDFSGKSDPYVVLLLKKSNQRKKTKVMYRTLNPVWNQTIEFAVENGGDEILVIEVWDHDRFRREFMGRCAMTLSKVLHEQQCRIEVQLGGVKSGRLLLDIKWYGL